MFKAKVGDDFYGLDPTVQELEAMSAELLGKEAGLFMPSGTMANAVALLSHTRRGDSMILEENAHVYRCETGHFAVVAGVVPKRIKGCKGVLDPAEIENALIGPGVLNPTTRLIWLENTHNAAGGTCTSVDVMERTKEIADKHRLKIHIDGERIFNAAIALEVDVKDLVCHADSIQFGLTKGLACPFGSVLVGSKSVIETSRKYRQMLGGGMRQAGVMAAAGIVGLKTMIHRMREDHENAKVLANGLARLGMDVDMETIQTNIVFFRIPDDVMEGDALAVRLSENGVIVNSPGRGNSRIRMVTHYGIEKGHIDETLSVLGKILGS